MYIGHIKRSSKVLEYPTISSTYCVYKCMDRSLSVGYSQRTPQVHFMIHSLISKFLFKKVDNFTSAEAFRIIMFVCVPSNSFVWRNNRLNYVIKISCNQDHKWLNRNPSIHISKSKICQKHPKTKTKADIMPGYNGNV